MSNKKIIITLVVGLMSTLAADTPVDVEGGTVKTEADGTKTVKRPDGTMLQVKPDGSKLITKPDGETIEIKADGSKIIKKADGTKIEIPAK